MSRSDEMIFMLVVLFLAGVLAIAIFHWLQSRPEAKPRVVKRTGSGPEPAATKWDTVVEAVRYDLLQRSLIGMDKYGTTLGENPAQHRERLQHAYEEALDLANYLKWSIMRLDAEAEAQAAPREMAKGCCSSVIPCSHQKQDPYTLCSTCEGVDKAWLAIEPNPDVTGHAVYVTKN